MLMWNDNAFTKRSAVNRYLGVGSVKFSGFHQNLSNLIGKIDLQAKK